MNIEKLKNYNQKMLAVLGSILVLMATVGLIMMIAAGISELRWAFRSDDSENGILSDEKIEELQKENKRQQLISYDFPRLTDTLNSIYIIPVRQKTLNAAEFIDGDGVLGLLDMHGGSKYKSDKRFSRRIYGSFNNLIIYDAKTKESKPLFDQRVNFSEIRTEQLQDDILVLFTAAEKDTYKDGVINLKDLKALYIYSMQEKKLRKVSNEGMDIENYGFVHESKDLIIHMGIDYSQDGTYDEYIEPATVRIYNYESDTLEEVINTETSTKLQKLLEGSVK